MLGELLDELANARRVVPLTVCRGECLISSGLFPRPSAFPLDPQRRARTGDSPAHIHRQSQILRQRLDGEVRPHAHTRLLVVGLRDDHPNVVLALVPKHLQPDEKTRSAPGGAAGIACTGESRTPRTVLRHCARFFPARLSPGSWFGGFSPCRMRRTRFLWKSGAESSTRSRLERPALMGVGVARGARRRRRESERGSIDRWCVGLGEGPREGEGLAGCWGYRRFAGDDLGGQETSNVCGRGEKELAERARAASPLVFAIANERPRCSFARLELQRDEPAKRQQ